MGVTIRPHPPPEIKTNPPAEGGSGLCEELSVLPLHTLLEQGALATAQGTGGFFSALVLNELFA